MENPRVGIDMKRGENNVWSVKVPLPSPEIYTYNFVVDGVAVNDPQNVLVQRDGTRYLPMLLVPGERSENYYEAKQHGTEILDKALERNGMAHTIYASEGGHTWYNWRLYLNTFARLLFK